MLRFIDQSIKSFLQQLLEYLSYVRHWKGNKEKGDHYPPKTAKLGEASIGLAA